MAILKIARMGHPVLRAVAAPVPDPAAPAIRRLIADMVDTLADAGGVGLAATQVHVPLRLLIFHVPASRSGTGADLPLRALINPVLTPLTEERITGWEGCLSVPGLRGVVPRYRRLHYGGLDAQGQPFERTVEGFHARVVQHEVDHLDGILFPQRVEDMTRFGFEDALVGQMVPTPD